MPMHASQAYWLALDALLLGAGFMLLRISIMAFQRPALLFEVLKRKPSDEEKAQDWLAGPLSIALLVAIFIAGFGLGLTASIPAH